MSTIEKPNLFVASVGDANANVAQEPTNQSGAAPGAPTVISPETTALDRLAASAPFKRAPNHAPYLIAGLTSLAWTISVAAMRPQVSGALGIALPLALAFAPLAFIWAAAFAIVQAQALLAEVRRARILSDQMLAPAALAAARGGTVLDTVRVQIAEASQAASQAAESLVALGESLSSETRALTSAAMQADASAKSLVDRLSGQRGELAILAVTLDARAAAVTDALGRHGRMVAEASELAEVQLRDAEASLTERTAALAAAAGQATDISRTGAEDLARQVAKLETAGLSVGAQLRSLEEGLTRQSAALVTVTGALRVDQEGFVALAETRSAELSALLSGTDRDVAALNEAAAAGANSMSELIEAAAARFVELAAIATSQRDQFGESAAKSLSTFSEIGARERAALEAQMYATTAALTAAAAEASEAADVHAEAARSRVEQLNEAALAAGESADQVLEARLGEARGLIAQSASLIEEACTATAARLGQGLDRARSALADLRGMVEQVLDSTQRLPAETSARADEVRAAVAGGMEELLAAARQTSQETQAIDAAFQERVKRNYEMLSEAVQLMGVVAQGGKEPAAPVSPAGRATLAGRATSRDRLASAPGAKAPAPPTGMRLKLMPTTGQGELTDVFDAPPDAHGEGDKAWSWKEFLTSIDGDAAAADIALGGDLFTEIGAMGIDAGAVLPRSAINEIVAAVRARDDVGARKAVRDLAPIAIRRLRRRLITDAAFATSRQTWIRRYAEILEVALNRDPDGYQATSLLASDLGRVYLLLDAAAGGEETDAAPSSLPARHRST
jgi:hypothetical protein